MFTRISLSATCSWHAKSLLLLEFDKTRPPQKSSPNAIFETILPKILLQMSILYDFAVFSWKKLPWAFQLMFMDRQVSANC